MNDVIEQLETFFQFAHEGDSPMPSQINLFWENQQLLRRVPPDTIRLRLQDGRLIDVQVREVMGE